MPNKVEPKFISNQPSGEDCFEGGTQKLLEKAIAKYICKTDSSNETINYSSNTNGKEIFKVSRIIGLEGAWGSGKSNVIKLLENDNDFCNKYKIFTYDAWGHQEDLQRRSILENLTIKLIQDKYLNKNDDVEIRLRNGEKKKAKWEEQLNYLLSNKTTTVTTHTPLVSKTFAWAVLIILLFQICIFVVNKFFVDHTIDSLWWFFIFIIPVLIGGFLCYKFHKKDHDWNFLLEVTSGKNTNTIDEQYTSSEEPSVNEFKNWMKGLSGYIKSNKLRKLIIVIDNMDRLPREKVKQLWSSIYTFFAGSDYDNIWVIIPYDKIHLCKAFDEKDNESETMNNFIKKTFSIIYNVSPPIISDYEKLFNYYFEKAFGKREDQNLINQVYRILVDDNTPRNVISFINQLVSLYQIWGDNIKLPNMALYSIEKERIFEKDNKKSIDDFLLSPDLFEEVSGLYPDKETTRKELAALFYGLTDIELASQIPIMNYINKCFNGSGDINKYSKENHFTTILCNAINLQPLASVDKVINVMSKLDDNALSSDDKYLIQRKWDYLSNNKISIGYQKQEFDISLDSLLIRVSKKHKIELIKDFRNKMEIFPDFSGSKYYNAMSNLDSYLEKNKLNKICKVNVIDRDVDTSIFIDYMISAQNDYKKYKLHTNNKKLVSWYCNNLGNKNNNPKVVYYLKDNKEEYDFSLLLTTCENMIDKDQIDETNLCNVFYLYRILFPKRDILPKRISGVTISNIYSKLSSDLSFDKRHPGYADLCTMYIFIAKSEVNNINDEMLPLIAECVDYYVNYGDVLLSYDRNDNTVNKINKYMIENRGGEKLNIAEVAHNIEIIQKTYQIEWSILFKQLDRWSKSWGEANNENKYLTDIEKYFLPTLFDVYYKNPHPFVNKMIDIVIYKMTNKVNKGFLIDVNGNVVNNYWSNFVYTFLGTKKLPQLTNSLFTEIETVYDALVSTNNESMMQNETVKKMIEYVDDNAMYEYVNDKLQKYFIQGHDSTTVTFKYFEPWFRKLGIKNIESYAANFIIYFVKPISGNKECFRTIVNHKDFYIPIIIKGKPITNKFISDICDHAEGNSLFAEIKPDLEPYNEIKEDKE